MSIIIHPKFDVSVATLFPIASSLALARAIQKTFHITPKLKWPNDVLINGKKLAGMLIDAAIESERIKTLVLGVGINFKVNSYVIEKNIKKTENFYGVASLAKNHADSPVPLVQSFLYELEKVYSELNDGKIKSIVEQWTKLSSNIGKIVTITTSDGKITGKSMRIDNDGALIIKNKTKVQRILAGDISNIS